MQKEVVVILEVPPGFETLSDRETLPGPNLRNALEEFSATARPLFSVPPPSALESLDGGVGESLVREQARYLKVDVAEENAEALVERLQSTSGVEAAYIKPPTENPVAPNHVSAVAAPVHTAPVVPDFSNQQGYLNPAPGGVDARFAWTKSGGRGAGVGLIDIEGGWTFSHIDLLQNQGGLVAGSVYPEVSWRDHGTAVLGEIGGDGRAIIGIAPDTQQSAVSHGGIGSSAAIQIAAQKLKRGDILLLEMHRPGPRFNFTLRDDQKGYVAVEWWPDDLLAIQYAISLGILVIEAAGNGAENLDDTLYDRPAPGFPSTWRNPFRTPHDAEAAVVVGAGAPPSGAHGPDRSKLDFSNYGNRVDCQGWGRGVVTTGYGDLYRNSADARDESYWYTGNFSGTSSASPIVAGAAACLQGIAKAQGKLIKPLQLRNLLRNTGTPQHPGDAAKRIGPRPDLRQLIARAFATS